jgi:hypothetical protein
MAIVKDITNKKFNKLTAIKLVNKVGYIYYWLFKCDCGKESIIRKLSVTSGRTMSCGCFQKKRTSEASTTHGMKHNRFYNIWSSMKSRCDNSNNIGYRLYGGKGIKIEWNNFLEFKSDMYSIYLEHVKNFGELNTSIDRINYNGNYSKENCRWATCKEQSNNRSSNRLLTFNNKTQSLSLWAKELNINYNTLRTRLDRDKLPISQLLILNTLT